MHNPKSSMDEPVVCHLSLYILECAPLDGQNLPTYYCGQTHHLSGRLSQHWHRPPYGQPNAPAVGRGSTWSKKHRPRKVAFVKYQSTTADESAYTLALMHACGDWRRVRGAQWSKVDLRGPPPQLKDKASYAYALPDVSRFAVPSMIATTGRGWRRVVSK